MYLYYLLAQVSIVVVEMLGSLKSSESGGGSPQNTVKGTFVYSA